MYLFSSFDCLLCSLYAVRLIIAFVDVNKTYLILSLFVGHRGRSEHVR